MESTLIQNVLSVIAGLSVTGGAAYTASRWLKGNASSDKIRDASDSRYLEMLDRSNKELEVAKAEREALRKELNLVEDKHTASQFETIRLQGAIAGKDIEISRLQQYIGELVTARERLERGVKKLSTLIRKLIKFIERKLPPSDYEVSGLKDEVLEALVDKDFRPFDPVVPGEPKQFTGDPAQPVPVAEAITAPIAAVHPENPPISANSIPQPAGKSRWES